MPPPLFVTIWRSGGLEREVLMRFAFHAAAFNRGPAQSFADIEDAIRRLAADRHELRRKFWRKLRALAARLPFAEDLLAAHYCAFDRQTPLHVRAALIGAIAYFVLPADFVPDVLPVIGYSDDAAVLAAAVKLVSAHINEDHREAARRALERLRSQA